MSPEFMGNFVLAVIALSTLYNIYLNKRKSSDDPINDLKESIITLTVTMQQYNENFRNQNDRITKHGAEIDEHNRKITEHEFRIKSLEDKSE